MGLAGGGGDIPGIQIQNIIQCDAIRLGDVVLDNFTKASRDEHNILNQIYIRKY